MKKQMKKLALSKETLICLESTLGHLAGGASLACTNTNCCSGLATCATCGTQCTSRLC